jgi:hypothetical protein
VPAGISMISGPYQVFGSESWYSGFVVLSVNVAPSEDYVCSFGFAKVT